MPWFKVDDGLSFHPKVIAAGNAAMGLWVRAGAYCAAQLTDGRLPRAMLKPLGGRTRDAERLVECGLWETVDDGWAFRGWEDFQPTKAQVEADRRATADRVAAWRERRRNGGSNAPRNAVTSTVSNGSGTPAPTRPDPTRTTEKNTSSPATPATVTAPEEHLRAGLFDTFWAAYPRKVGKATARQAFDKAVRRTGNPARVIEGARRLAADPNLPEREFIPHPPTWLNRDGWEDEPFPARTNGRPPERPRTGSSVWSQVVGGEPQ